TARVLAQYAHELPKYFRRYQMQNVFRADKPQKGRYREFTQCDIDIFGSTDTVADAEIIACSYFALAELGFKAPRIVVNDRQVLFATLSPFVTEIVDVFSIIQSVDKLDKKSESDVAAELVKKGLSPENATLCLQEITSAEPTESLKEILSHVAALGVPEDVVSFEPTIARGLDYYTGMIFEIKIPEYGAGSVGGGGRYDELIEKLGGNSVPAVGIAFGFDRLVEAVQVLALDSKTEKAADVLVTLFGAELTPKSLEVAAKLRAQGISAEIYPNQDEKLGKQFAYADKRQIPQVIVLGPNEINNKTVVLKSMETGEQTEMTVEDAIRLLQD
ncbi:MAG: histidine--tRNA ligase, partial [Microgenomates group bacterium]